MGRQGAPITSVPISAKPVELFMAAHCNAGPVYSGRCLESVYKNPAGLVSQVVYVRRFESVSVALNEDGDTITAIIITQSISKKCFCMVTAIGLPDCLDRFNQFGQTSSLNYPHEIVCVRVCVCVCVCVFMCVCVCEITAFALDHFHL